MSDRRSASRSPPARTRAERAALRRGAIVSAALAEFSERGFTSTRMEDVARRADVAKGTLYLHFADKTDLFRAIVRQVIVPVADEISAGRPDEGESIRDYLDRLMPALAETLTTPPRSDVVRLLVAEGQRFPELSELYYEEVVSRGVGWIRTLALEAENRGELPDDTLRRFPHLLFAPTIMSVIWSGMFSRFEPLDVRRLVSEQLRLVFGRSCGSTSGSRTAAAKAPDRSAIRRRDVKPDR